MEALKHKNSIRFLAALLIGGGILGIGICGVLANKMLRIHWVYAFIVVAFVALYLWTTLTGVRLWRNEPRGWKWAIILFASQVPILTVPGLRYAWYTGLNIGLVGGSVDSPLRLEMGASIDFYLDTRIDELLYGINVFALIAVIYLLAIRPNNSLRADAAEATQA